MEHYPCFRPVCLQLVHADTERALQQQLDDTWLQLKASQQGAAAISGQCVCVSELQLMMTRSGETLNNRKLVVLTMSPSSCSYWLILHIEAETNVFARVCLCRFPPTFSCRHCFCHGLSPLIQTLFCPKPRAAGDTEVQRSWAAGSQGSAGEPGPGKNQNTWPVSCDVCPCGWFLFSSYSDVLVGSFYEVLLCLIGLKMQW